MIGSISSNFSDVVVIRERVKNGMRSGKITLDSSRTIGTNKPSGWPGKKKDRDVNMVTFNSPGTPSYRPSQ